MPPVRKKKPVRRPRVAGPARVKAGSDDTAQRAEMSRHPAEYDRDRDDEVHLSRDREYPSDAPVHEDDDGDWLPPSRLEAPPPRPGYTQRWIRVRRGNTDDLQNFMARKREGWQSRDPATIPGGFSAPSDAHGKFGNCVMVEGMVLCEMPLRRAKQRKAYYAAKLGRQTQAVEQQLRQAQEPGHPIDHRSKTVVTVGKQQRRPHVQQDDEAA